MTRHWAIDWSIGANDRCRDQRTRGELIVDYEKGADAKDRRLEDKAKGLRGRGEDGLPVGGTGLNGDALVVGFAPQALDIVEHAHCLQGLD
jgi:hypothetical protein